MRGTSMNGTQMTDVPPAPRPPLVRRPLFWLILAAGLLLVALAIAIGLAIRASGGASDAASTMPPTSTQSTAGSDAVTPPSTDAPATDPPEASVIDIPATCAGIYTRDWSAEMAPRVLNPAWIDDPVRGFKRWGSNDVGLVTVLEATTRLECNWVPESGAGHLFLVTGVAQLTPDQQGSTLDYLAESDMECYDELSGTRCVMEREEAGETWGESHFLREGIWIATRWGGNGPDGYTHDIVAAIFG
jgi:hypothetical protein